MLCWRPAAWARARHGPVGERSSRPRCYTARVPADSGSQAASVGWQGSFADGTRMLSARPSVPALLRPGGGLGSRLRTGDSGDATVPQENLGVHLSGPGGTDECMRHGKSTQTTRYVHPLSRIARRDSTRGGIVFGDACHLHPQPGPSGFGIAGGPSNQHIAMGARGSGTLDRRLPAALNEPGPDDCCARSCNRGHRAARPRTRRRSPRRLAPRRRRRTRRRSNPRDSRRATGRRTGGASSCCVYTSRGAGGIRRARAAVPGASMALNGGPHGHDGRALVTSSRTHPALRSHR